MRDLETEFNRIIKSTVAVIVGICLIGTFIGLFKAKKSAAQIQKQNAYAHRPNESQSSAFAYAWQGFIKSMSADKIIFKGQNPPLADILNRANNKNTISISDFYASYGSNTPDFISTITGAVKEKFNKEIQINTTESPGVVLYSMTNKSFNFKIPFDKLLDKPFNGSGQNVKYFGINWLSDGTLRRDVKVLFYNNENDFAISILNTNDEIILYRTSLQKTPEAAYKDILRKQKLPYSDFPAQDTLYVPYLAPPARMVHNELTGREIENMNKTSIILAIDDFDFKLDRCGLNVDCPPAKEKNLDSDSFDSYKKGRDFNFDKNFVLFLKEKNSRFPYYTLFVDNDNILVHSM